MPVVCCSSSWVAASRRIPPARHNGQLIERVRPRRSSGGHLPIAVCGKPVQKAVRSGVIGLSQIAQCAGDGREQHEEVEINVLARQIQVERSRDLGRQYLAEFRAGLLRDEVIRNHPGAVKDAGEPAVRVCDGGDELPDLIEIAEIDLSIAHTPGVVRQRVQAGLCFRRQRRASGQDDTGLTGLGEDLSGKEQAELAEPASDQVDAVLVEGDRRRIPVVRHLLPTQDLPAAMFVSDQRIQGAGLLLPEVAGEFLRCHFR